MEKYLCLVAVCSLMFLATSNADASSCSTTCQVDSESSSLRELDLVSHEEDLVVQLRCSIACNKEVAPQYMEAGSGSSDYNRDSEEVAMCLNSCLSQHEDTSLSGVDCRALCGSNDSCITGCTIYERLIREEHYSGSGSGLGNLDCRTSPSDYLSPQGEELLTPHTSVDCSTLSAKNCSFNQSEEQMREARCCGFCSGPETPANPPVVNDTEDRAMEAEYTISIPDSVTTEGIAYLLRVEDLSGHVTTYFPAMEPVTAVSLLSSMCSRVSVTFAVVNEYGVSDYSPATELCIEQSQRVPGAPQNLQVQFEEDRREDIYGRGHAAVNITWDRPEGHENLSFYQILLESVDNRTDRNSMMYCVGQESIFVEMINKNDTGYVLVAANRRMRTPPRFDCKYKITVSSHPGQANATKEFQIRYTERTSLNLACEVNFNSTTAGYDVMAKWSIQNGLVLEVIQRFDTVVERLLSEGLPAGRVARRTIFVVSEMNLQFEVSYTNLSILRENEGSYILNVNPEGTNALFWRRPLIPRLESCHFIALPVKPTVIQVIQVENVTFVENRRQIQMVVSWEPPLHANGDLQFYQLRVGREEIPPRTDEIRNSRSFRLEIQPMEDELFISAFLPIAFQADAEDTLYLQMRSRNQYLFSDWSEPVLLNRSETSETPVTSSEPTSTTVTVVTTDKKESGSGLPMFAFLIFGGVGTMLLVAIAIPFCVWCRRTYCPKMDVGEELIRTIEPGKKPSVFHFGYPIDEWEISPEEVEILGNKPLGKGCYGEVYKGILRPSSARKHPLRRSKSAKYSLTHTVAVKRLKGNATGSEKSSFWDEIKMMKRVSDPENELSRFVVNMVGCITVQEPLLLILEFIKHGDLLTYLRSMRKQAVYFSPQAGAAMPYLEPIGIYSRLEPKDEQFGELGTLEERNLLEFARQIAAGMDFLSSLKIVHRDLACRNILVGENKTLKISDFGLSRVLLADEVYESTSHGLLPLRWMAPESIFHREFTTASDVWSYGVLLWEICTLGGFPYPLLTNRDLISRLKYGYRMEKPSNCSPEVYEIMLDCWQYMPLDRPKFSDLHSSFDKFLSKYIQDRYPYIEIQTGPPYSFDKLEPITCTAKDEQGPINFEIEDFDSTKGVPSHSHSSIGRRFVRSLQLYLPEKRLIGGRGIRSWAGSLTDLSFWRESEPERLSLRSIEREEETESRYVESPIAQPHSNTLMPPDVLSQEDELMRILEPRPSNLGPEHSQSVHLETTTSEFPSPKSVSLSVPEVNHINSRGLTHEQIQGDMSDTEPWTSK